MGSEEIKMGLEVYIIQYNNNSISKKGYSTLKNAIKFINTRSYNPKPVRVLLYVDDQGNEYKILPINVK
jgi:hypothetical protein